MSFGIEAETPSDLLDAFFFGSFGHAWTPPRKPSPVVFWFPPNSLAGTAATEGNLMANWVQREEWTTWSWCFEGFEKGEAAKLPQGIEILGRLGVHKKLLYRDNFQAVLAWLSNVCFSGYYLSSFKMFQLFEEPGGCFPRQPTENPDALP